MSFRQQLARQTVNLQQAYDVETQQIMQQWVAETRQKFIRECEAASQRRQFSTTIGVPRPQHLTSRGVQQDLLQQQMQGILAELGFQDGAVSGFETSVFNGGRYVTEATMSANWAADDSTSTSLEPIPAATGGTSVTCPICHEHRPAVVLMPCGHVVCRDCQRCKQLRQCPMCREVITSASRGLFMD